MSSPVRVALLGESRVGKTTLVRSYVARTYRPACECTYGIEVTAATTNSDDVAFQFWDVGGAYPPIPEIMARHAAVIVLAFADADSFSALDRHWMPVARAAQTATRARGFAAPLLVLARLQSDRVGGDVAARDSVHAAYARHIGASAYATVTATSTDSVDAFVGETLARLARSDPALPRSDADYGGCRPQTPAVH